MSNVLKVPLKAPLSEMDIAEQTYGCRATNPDNCVNNGLANMYAFISGDDVYKKPSLTWKKQCDRMKNPEVQR